MDRADGTCATCRWWDEEDATWNYEAQSPTGHHPCELTATGEWFLGVASLARAWDHEGYAAALWTSPDFGCVQWAAWDSDSTP